MSHGVFCDFSRLVQPTAVSHDAFAVSALRIVGSRVTDLPFDNRVGRGVRHGHGTAHCACVPAKCTYMCVCVSRVGEQAMAVLGARDKRDG